MTVAYLSSNFAANASGTDVNTVSVTKPTGVVSGTAMFAICSGFQTTPTTITAPSGWTAATSEVDSGTAITARIFTKTAGGSEPSSYTFNWAAATGAVSAVIIACSGAPSNWETTYQVSMTDNSTTDPSTANTYSVTSAAGALVFTGACFHRNGTNSTTASAGWTEIQDFVRQDGAPGTNWRGQSAYRLTSGTPTALGATTPSNSIDFANAPTASVKWTFSVPETPAGVDITPKVEILTDVIDEVWTDITADVQYDAGISITRGQSGEGSAPDTSRLSLTLDNRSGNYSPRNPNGAYYGMIGRNTGIRVSAGNEFRFSGEVSNWPQHWDSTGNFVYVPLEASGIRRRLESGSPPALSAMKRNYVARANPDYTYNQVIAYWPCEDEDGATNVGSGLANGTPMIAAQSPTSPSGLPAYGDDTRVLGSAPLLTLNGCSLTGKVPDYTATDEIFLRFYYHHDTTLSTIQDIISLQTTGSAYLWTIGADATSALYLKVLDTTDTTTVDILNSLIPLNSWTGAPVLDISLKLSKSGSNIAYSVEVTDFQNASTFQSGAVTSDSGTISTNTLGSAKKVSVFPNLANSAIGHIAVGDSIASLDNNATAMVGNRGEDTGTRFERLCLENDINFTVVPASTIYMGVQGVKSTMDLIKECADTDHGFLEETRTNAGITLVNNQSLYNQAATLALNYSTFQLSGELLPEEDDALTSNDVTVMRDGGSSARVSETVGRLSVQDPPDGVGLYSSSTTLSLYSDPQCASHAQWLVHLGTVDESRYPTVQVAMENPRIAASPTLMQAVLDTDIGDRITISNPPSWLPPEDISLMVVGYTETFDQFQHGISYVCVPYSPYNIAVTDDSNFARADTDNSSLSATASSSTTSLTVATDSTSARWIDSATYTSDFPFDIMVGGERMTVTALTGTSSPQTFTVTRHVNGITKAHNIGEEVHVFLPVYVGF